MENILESCIIAEWKTKKILKLRWTNDVIIESKNSITAWDWLRKEELENKWKISNTITCNIFKYLNDMWISTHFIAYIDESSFLANECDMITLEVVYRYVATWSFIKRNSSIQDWQLLEIPVYELFYKNDVFDKDWKRYSDPMIKLYWNTPILEDWKFILLDPKTWNQINYVSIKNSSWEELSYEEYKKQVLDATKYSYIIHSETDKIFESLKNLFHFVWIELFDWKIEFWVNKKWELMLSDVIDWDSLRLRKDIQIEQIWDKQILSWEWLDKQWFREWESTSITIKKYETLSILLDEALECHYQAHKDHGVEGMKYCVAKKICNVVNK